jgi:hypothetical protein
MGATIEREKGNLIVLRITGPLKKSEFDAALAAEARQWRPTSRVKVLVIVEDFKGWERGADWGDVAFFFEHDHQIEKIAIVSDPKWEVQTLVFGGAGVRRGEVKFLPTNQMAQARAWLGDDLKDRSPVDN